MIESEYNSEELLPDDDDLFLLNLDSGDAPSPSPPQLEGGPNPDSFPTVLHDIVSDESTDDCICWLPCGTRFQITDKKKVRFYLHEQIMFLFITSKVFSQDSCFLSLNPPFSFQRTCYPFILAVEVQPSSLALPAV